MRALRPGIGGLRQHVVMLASHLLQILLHAFVLEKSFGSQLRIEVPFYYFDCLAPCRLPFRPIRPLSLVRAIGNTAAIGQGRLRIANLI